MKYLFSAFLLFSFCVSAMPLTTYKIRSNPKGSSTALWQDMNGYRLRLCPATEAVADILLSLTPDPKGETECDMATLLEVGCIRVFRIENCRQ